jgi:hypothetical protein
MPAHLFDKTLDSKNDRKKSLRSFENAIQVPQTRSWPPLLKLLIA